MKLLKYIVSITLIMAPIGIYTTPNTKVTGDTAQETLNVTVVEMPNHERIAKARAAYALRAKWAPVIKCSILGAGIGITLASFFAYYWHASEFTPAEMQKIRELIATSQDAGLEKSTGWLQNPGTFFMFLATGIAQGGALNILNYGISSLTGNLEWYVQNQTAYQQDLAYVQQSLNFYAIFKDTIGTTIQLLMFDVEKILGYLQYCRDVSCAKKSSTVLASLENHMRFIEEHAMLLAQGFNNQQSKEYLVASLELLKTDIASTIKFIGVYA